MCLSLTLTQHPLVLVLWLICSTSAVMSILTGIYSWPTHGRVWCTEWNSHFEIFSLLRDRMREKSHLKVKKQFSCKVLVLYILLSLNWMIIQRQIVNPAAGSHCTHYYSKELQYYSLWWDLMRYFSRLKFFLSEELLLSVAEWCVVTYLPRNKSHGYLEWYL